MKSSHNGRLNGAAINGRSKQNRFTLPKSNLKDDDRENILLAICASIDSPDEIYIILKRLNDFEELLEKTGGKNMKEGEDTAHTVEDLVGRNVERRNVLRTLSDAGVVYIDMSDQRGGSMLSRSKVFITDMGVRMMSVLSEDRRRRLRLEREGRLAAEVEENRSKIISNILSEIRKQPGYPRGKAGIYSRFQRAAEGAYDASNSVILEYRLRDARNAAYLVLDEVRVEEEQNYRRGK